MLAHSVSKFRGTPHDAKRHMLIGKMSVAFEVECYVWLRIRVNGNSVETSCEVEDVNVSVS